MSDIRAYAWEDLVAITPSDTVVFSKAFAGLRVENPGTVKFMTGLGNTVTLTAIAGDLFPFVCKQVFASGTTASGIYGAVQSPYFGSVK